MRAEPEPEAPRAIIAAVTQVDLGPGSSWKSWRFGNADWQAESWRLYDVVGEHGKLARRVGAACAKARLYVTEVDESGEETGEVKDPGIRALAGIPLGTGAGRDENLRLVGAGLAAAGECWLVGEDVLGKVGDPVAVRGRWFVVTGASLSGGNGQPVKVKRPRSHGGGELRLIDKRDVLIRCWFSHPNNPDEADSYARSAIPVLREIELLTKRQFAELDSRLTGAGMMPVPESATLPRGPDDPEGISGTMALMQRTMAASMMDQSTAAAMMPILFSVPDELMDKIDAMKPITFWSPLSAEIPQMKSDAIVRFASFPDIPAESLTGMGQANHWSAWLISEEGIRWIGQYLGVLADALTQGFLRFTLAAMGVENPERYAYAFDTSPLAARPNRLEDAVTLRDRNLLSDVEVVRAGAFDPEQMPKDDELMRQRLWDLVKADPSLIRDPAVQKALGLPEVAPAVSPTPEAISEPDEDDRPVNGPPELDGGDPRPAITASLEARIAALSAPPGPQAVFNAAAKLLVLRALELAGGRLATPAERHGRWKDVPRHDLHHEVGPIPKAKAEQVLAGAWAHVPIAAADLGVDAGDLGVLLNGYVMELLTRGIRHSDDLLFHGLSIANQGRGLLG